MTGLGFLSVVPLEIRDLIFRHVFFDKYHYSTLSNPSIGLLGASKALRHEAADQIYSQTKCQLEFKENPGIRRKELSLSQEVVKSHSF